MNTSCKAKLKEARTVQEAKNVLSENRIRLGPAGTRLLETAFLIKETQPQYFESFMTDVIREAEEKPKKAEETGATHDDGVDKDDMVSEADKVQSGSGNAGSAQSSSIDGLEKKGSTEPDSDIEGMDSASGEDQMGKISEDLGMCPQGMSPEVYQQMMGGKQAPQMPQMNTPQMMKQMQYTVKTMTAPLVKEIQRLRKENAQIREAYTALDQKVQETSRGAGKQMGLFDTSNKFSKPLMTQETTTQVPSNAGMLSFPERRFPNAEMNDTRESIRELNKAMNRGEIPNTIYG